MFQISNLLLAADFSAEVANNSAVGMIGSFIAGLTYRYSSYCIFDFCQPERFPRAYFYRKTLVFVEVLSTLYIGDISNPLKNNFLEKECGQC